MGRKCRYCKSELPPVNKCTDPFQAKGFCSVDCMAEHGLAKAQENRQKQIHKMMQPQIKAAPKKKSQTGLTQSVFNRMIRLLDEGKPCISCGNHKCGTYWDAGHKRSVGSCPELRFDPRNCHRQGSACNRANRRPDKNQSRGAETIAQEYEQRLRERYGHDLVDWLNGPHQMPRWRDDDLRKLRAVFAQECRKLGRGEGPSRDWRGLDYCVANLIN